MVLVACVVLESACSFWSTLHTDDHGSFWKTRTGPRHALAYGCFWKNFLSFSLALFALEIWCFISIVLVSGSHCSGRLGVAEEYGNLDFREMSFSVGAVLCTTVDTCSASVLWTYSHIFYVAADSNPEAFLLHSV